MAPPSVAYDTAPAVLGDLLGGLALTGPTLYTTPLRSTVRGRQGGRACRGARSHAPHRQDTRRILDMNTTSTWAVLRERLDDWRVIIAFGVIYVASQTALAVIVAPLGGDMLRVQTSLSAETVRGIFARWDDLGLLPVYSAHYTLDMVHPIWYAVLLAAMLAKGFNANQVATRWNPLLSLPFAAAACDVIENLAHIAFLADRSMITTGWVLLANGAANIKWLIALGSVVAVLALTWRAYRQRDTSCHRAARR